MISQLPGIRGRMGLVQSKGFWVNPIPCQSDLGEGAASCYFLSVHLPPSTTPGFSCHTSVVYPLPYLLFSSSSPPPGFCLGSCTISAFPNLRKMQIKSFTVLKYNFFFYYRSLADLFLSGSHFVVYAIVPFLNSEVCS